mmetsp:Transcript_96808/g.301411  ORF Transcript_96808/g.301411 Transcript_96808/m.301411 type:complete len:266 (+) Transcript_96808:268-1065(+)
MGERHVLALGGEHLASRTVILPPTRMQEEHPVEVQGQHAALIEGEALPREVRAGLVKRRRPPTCGAEGGAHVAVEDEVGARPQDAAVACLAGVAVRESGQRLFAAKACHEVFRREPLAAIEALQAGQRLLCHRPCGRVEVPPLVLAVVAGDLRRAHKDHGPCAEILEHLDELGHLRLAGQLLLRDRDRGHGLLAAVLAALPERLTCEEETHLLAVHGRERAIPPLRPPLPSDFHRVEPEGLREECTYETPERRHRFGRQTQNVSS